MKYPVPSSFFRSAVTVLLLLALASCRSHRKVMQDGDGVLTDGTSVPTEAPAVAQRSIVTQVNANRQPASGLRAKMSMRLVAGTREVTVGGSLKMKRDEIIQLQLTALGLLEVGRLELTPGYLFVQDKINKRYVHIGWDEVPALQATGIGFATFQALFWNELFVLGKTTEPAESDFKTIRKKNTVTLEPAHVTAAQKDLALSFLVDAAQNLIQQTSVSAQQKAKVSFACAYDDFAPIDDKPFPRRLSLTVASDARTYRADITLSRLQADNTMGNLATSVNNLSYKEVTFDEIMNLITKHTSK